MPDLFKSSSSRLNSRQMATPYSPTGRRYRRDRQRLVQRNKPANADATSSPIKFVVDFKPFSSETVPTVEVGDKRENEETEKIEDNKFQTPSMCDFCGADCQTHDWPASFCQKQARSLVDAAVKRDVERLKQLLAERQGKPVTELAESVPKQTERGKRKHKNKDKGATQTNEDIFDNEQEREISYALLMAVSMRQTEMVEILLKAGASTRMNEWYPLIITAADLDSPDIIKLLLEHGVDPNFSSPMGSALHAAARVGSLKIIKLLHYSGVELEKTNEAHGRTPLHFAAEWAHKDAVQYFVDEGCKIDPKDQNGRTPLHLAARTGRYEVIELLLNSGASLDAIDDEQMTPWMHAVERDHPDVLDHESVDMRDQEGRTLLHRSCRAGAVKCVRKLIKLGASCDSTTPEGVTPLMDAVENGHNAVVSCLLTENPKPCDVNKVSENWESALSLALKRSFQETQTQTILRLLITAGADPNVATDADGKTLLMVHVCNEDERNWLVANGANLNQVCGAGTLLTAMATAFASPWNHDADKGLLDRVMGHNVDLRISSEADQSGRTPLQIVLSKWATSLAKDMIAYGFSLAHMLPWLPQEFARDAATDEYVELLTEIKARCQQPLRLSEHCRLAILPTFGCVVPGETKKWSVNALPYFQFSKLTDSQLARSVVGLPLPRRLQHFLLPAEYAKWNAVLKQTST